MKKSKIILLPLLAVIIVLVSCTTEGPAGPAGEDGTDGVTTTIYETDGYIDTDTTWSGEVYLTTDIVVDSAILTIADNTTVYTYDHNFYFYDASLIAKSASKNIIFGNADYSWNIKSYNNSFLELSNIIISSSYYNLFYLYDNTVCNINNTEINGGHYYFYDDSQLVLNNSTFEDFFIGFYSSTLNIINSVKFYSGAINTYSYFTGTVNIDSSDIVGNNEYGLGNDYAIYGQGGTINLNNCYIFSNNGSTIIATSTTVPDDPDSPQQYVGVTSITAPRSTPNF